MGTTRLTLTNGQQGGVGLPAWLIALLAVLLSSSLVLAESAQEKRPGHALQHPVSLLLTQSADAISYADGELRLHNIAPMVLMFADSPQVLEGFLPLDDFATMWAAGWNRYSADPPNAALQILEPADQAPILIELKQARLEGDDLIYAINLLEGALPAEAGAASLFIDSYVWVPPDRGPQPLGWIRCYTQGRGVPQCYSDW